MVVDSSSQATAADERPQVPMRSPPYAEYLYNIYQSRILANHVPETTTDFSALEEQARQAMARDTDGLPCRSPAFGYIAGGAGTGATMVNNRRALDHWSLVPRMMRPGCTASGPGVDAATAALRDLRVRLFAGGEATGRGPPLDLQSPVVLAPVGVMCAYHPDREVGVATACAELGVPFSISSASSSSIEEVKAGVDAAATDPDAPPPPAPWFQLYWPKDDDITASVLSRARAIGSRVLLVTADTFTISWRPTDLDVGYLPFLTTGEGNAIGFSDPVFRQKLAASGETADGAPMTPENSGLAAAMRWTSEAFPRRARPWADLANLRRLWGDDGAILVKGIQHPDDALLARQAGADGVVVSNHGGRQVDGAVGALRMLPEIVRAVRDAEAREGYTNGRRFTILFDSGLRTGSDIIKALCLGAEAVLVARPVIYGLGIAGQAGAKHVLAGLLADLDQTMNLIGCASIAEMGPHMLHQEGTGSMSML